MGRFRFRLLLDAGWLASQLFVTITGQIGVLRLGRAHERNARVGSGSKTDLLKLGRFRVLDRRMVE